MAVDTAIEHFGYAISGVFGPSGFAQPEAPLRSRTIAQFRVIITGAELAIDRPDSVS